MEELFSKISKEEELRDFLGSLLFFVINTRMCKKTVLFLDLICFWKRQDLLFIIMQVYYCSYYISLIICFILITRSAVEGISYS